MPFSYDPRFPAAPEERILLHDETVYREEIDDKTEYKDYVDGVIKNIKSLRVINRLVNKTGKYELKRGTRERKQFCQREKNQDK